MKPLLIAFLVLFSACDKPTEPDPPSLSGTWNSSITATGYSSQPPLIVIQQEQNIQFRLTFSTGTWELYGTVDPTTFKLKLTGTSAESRLAFEGTTTFLYNRIDGTLSVRPKDYFAFTHYAMTATKN